VAVTDLDDVELLHDAAVKPEFLLLEFLKDKPTEIDGQHVKESLIVIDISFSGGDFVCHATDIAFRLE